MDPSIIAANSNFSQNIKFKGSDNEYSAEIVAQDVTVSCSSGAHENGSSKVKLTNVVDYQWEFKYYIGQLIAIHIDGKIIAYGIKGKTGGMLRVARTDSNERTLIKDIKGLVQDVSFALTSLQIILGVVDEEGNLFVYNIEDNESIKCTLLLHVMHPVGRHNTNYRVIWCPYVPSYDENPDTIDDPAKLLVLLNGNRAEVWDVSVVNTKYGAGPIQPHEEYEGFVEISGHSLDIIDASFSPDGTAIATASLDGYVKFFQVYMVENEKPRCLHHWKPHDGKALSCLLFLDNVNAYGTDSKFWKFAITGANHNAELKIWSCESWTCLQTIRFVPNPESPSPELFIKVRIDLTASFILLSDINNRVLYVLQIHKNEEERLASAVTISEFLLPAAFMSFCIANATTSKFKYSNSSEDIYQEDGDDYDEDNNVSAISIKLYTVQPKRLQECTITFQADTSIIPNSNSTYENILEHMDGTEEIDTSNFNDVQAEAERENTEITKLDDLQSSVTLLIQQQQNSQPLNLMTPADFNSPVVANQSPNERLRSSLGNEVTSPSSMLKKSLEKLPESTVDNLIDFQQPQKDNFASGGSSPSREVQEILAFNNPSYNPQEYFDSLSKTADENNFDRVESDTKAKEVVWPNIPTMKAIEIQMKEENRRKEQMKLPQEDQEAGDSNWNKAQIQTLNYRISGLESLIREQNSEIQKLQHYLKSQRTNVTPDYDIRSIISNELEMAFSKNQTHTIKMLENFNKEQKRKDWEQLEILITNVMKNLLQKISDSLQEIISREIKNTVLPPVMATFDKLLHQLDIHYSQKINTIDQLLKSNISKLVSSKAVTESLSMSIISVIKPSLEECYKDMISTTLIPSCEKVCNSMFLQIHNTFTQGTKEYTSSVESYMDKQRRVQDKGKDLITQMQAVSETMKNNTEKLSNHLSAEIQRQFHLSFNNMQEALKHTIAEHVKEQVKVGFKLHASVLEDSVVNAVRSRAVTPSPHVIDTQVQLAQIQNLLAKGNIDVAFQQALSASASASDLSLVLHVCEKVNPQDVFNQGTCLLQQHVLLSLVQQLGADLSHHTDIKLRYLEEAILNLDPKNPVTREHLPIVLRELSKQLTQFIANNPTNKHSKDIRMLQMATQSVLKS